MKLIVFVCDDAHADASVDALVEQGFYVTRLATTGGFLRRGNTTLLVGLPGTTDPAAPLATEVARLGAAVGADANDLVAFEPNDAGRPFLTVDPDGVYHWMVVDGDAVLEDRTTTSRDDVLFWSFEAATAGRGQAERLDLLRAIQPRWEAGQRR